MKVRMNTLCRFFAAFIFTCFFGAPQNAAAEDFRGAHSQFFRLLLNNRSDTEFEYTFSPEQEEDSGPGKFDLHQFALDGEFALPLSRDTFWRLGWETSARYYDFEQVRSARTSTNDDTYYKLLGKVGAGTFISDDFLITGLARLGTLTDFEGGIDSDDFALFGNGLLVYRMNAGTEIVGGVQYSEDFDSQSVFPIVGLRIMSDEGRIHLSIMAPLEARLAYSVIPQAQLYARVAALGEEYEVSSGEVNNFKARIEERRAGIGTKYWFGERLSIGAEAGVFWGSELKFKTRNPGQFSDGDIDPAGYLSLNLGLAL